MQYHIFCKETHKYLCTYNNAETLKTLDTTRCYYKEETVLIAYANDSNPLANKFRTTDRVAKKSQSSVSGSSRSASNNTSSNHHYYPQSYSHTSSDSCSSDSSSIDSSSSCDSGSY